MLKNCPKVECHKLIFRILLVVFIETEVQKVYMKPTLMKGTYLCHGENDYGIDVAILENLVLDKPQLDFNQVVPVGTDKIFFNWTVSDWNSPITDYFLSVSHFS